MTFDIKINLSMFIKAYKQLTKISVWLCDNDISWLTPLETYCLALNPYLTKLRL